MSGPGERVEAATEGGIEAPSEVDLPPPNRMLSGKHVYRVVWKLRTDILVGYCWCGQSHESEDPIELWEWLLEHPDTHGQEEQ